MSMKTLEKAILSEARIVTKRPKLRMKDIMEWSTSNIKPHEGEQLYHLPNMGVNICIKE